MKTNKSFTKRLKLTKNGKIISRKKGTNHFNAKESRASQLSGRRNKTFTIKNKPKSHLMPFS